MSRIVTDETWAVMTIWQEARGEEQPGRVAVAEVIRNRTQQQHMSDGTVAGTVLAPFQFSGWNSRDPNRIAAAKMDDCETIVMRCRQAWHEAMTGSDITNGALYYVNLAVARPEWIHKFDEVAVIGRHTFYRPR